MAATKFLKKLFCIGGRSPAIRTKKLINAKQKADMIKQIKPLYRNLHFHVLLTPLSFLLSFHYIPVMMI